MEEKRSTRKKSREDFIVRIMCNEHSTWQGEIMWVEKQEKQYFRSALELLRLIDNALETSHMTNGEKRDWA